MVRAPPRHAGVHMATSPEVGGLACAEMIEQPPVLVMLVLYINRGLPHLVLVCPSARGRSEKVAREPAARGSVGPWARPHLAEFIAACLLV